jgi:hypothetical protein
LKTYRFDFMRWRPLTTGLSAAIVTLSLIGLVFRGLDLGIEFTGGALFDAHFPAAVTVDEVRATLAANGLSAALVQGAGSEQDVVIRMPTTGYANVGELAERLADSLEAVQDGAAIVNSEVIGPALGRRAARLRRARRHRLVRRRRPVHHGPLRRQVRHRRHRGAGPRRDRHPGCLHRPGAHFRHARVRGDPGHHRLQR